MDITDYCESDFLWVLMLFLIFVSHELESVYTRVYFSLHVVTTELGTTDLCILLRRIMMASLIKRQYGVVQMIVDEADDSSLRSN
ncbi:hypothetical protein VNO77_41637 [Canavalia gladiata]|uniref:Uncharacterized protein n=1 Tax=Canavalia gladiata TaxID=3824 RepID=A0AAN9PRQ3_CANGL